MDSHTLLMPSVNPLLPGATSSNLDLGIDGAEAFFDFGAFAERPDADMLDAEHNAADVTPVWNQMQDLSHPPGASEHIIADAQVSYLPAKAWDETDICYDAHTTGNIESACHTVEIPTLSIIHTERPHIPLSASAAALDLEAGNWLPGLDLTPQDDLNLFAPQGSHITPVKHTDSILPEGHQEDTRVQKRKTSKRSKATSSALSKRTSISNEARKVLDTHFDINPYPKEHEISSLLQKTKLTGRTIKTWFSNARSRRGAAMFSNESATETSLAQVPQHEPSSPSSVSGITRTSLELHNQQSPASSMGSLERFMSELISDDSESEAIAESTAYLNIDHKNLHKLSGSTLNEVSSMHQHGIFEVPRTKSVAKSIADSEASFGSFKSLSSHASFKTVDSRGCRRGRKRWYRTSMKKVEATDKRLDAITKKEEKKSPRFFCTWSSCSKEFQHRYEWVRHEEAVHYQPNHWVCCLEEAKPRTMPSCIICGQRNATLGHMVECHASFDTCIDKCQDSRTFLREDQLVQHIKGSHLGQETTKRSIENLLCNWKIDNPAFDETNLKCGFCGLTLDSWDERQQHVSKHLQSGMCKLSWWPERLPLVPTMASLNRNDPFTCPNCSLSTANFTTAFFVHSHCTTYSCRNLHDLHAAFLTTHFGANAISSTCRLCDWTIDNPNDKDDIFIQRLAAHADTHGLRNCDQDIFTSPEDFVTHLNSVHGAKWQKKSDWTLEAWRCDQNLMQSPKGCSVQTKSRSHSRLLCCTEAYYQVVETPCV